MKIKFLKSSNVKITQRGPLARLALACLILLALTPAAGQLKNQKRLSLQLGEALEGSRVTVVSDSPLNDYEAFRRGDRFYVKIPLAEFATSVPGLRANGFDDVQVQRVGDGLIISFKLQPGASARVSLRGNRLDVIFAAANRSSYLANRTATASEARAENDQNTVERGRDTAGPLPQESTTAGNDGRGLQDPWAINSAGNTGRRGKRNVGNQISGNAEQTSTAQLSPTPAFTPGSSSSYPSLSSTTPTSSPASSTALRSSSTFRQRASSVAQWISANRLGSLIGALILLSLILYLALFFRKRRQGVARAKLAKAKKVQPKYSQVSDLNESSTSPTDVPISSVKSEPAAQNSAVTPDRPATRIPSPRETSRAANASAAPHGAGAWGVQNQTVTTEVAAPVDHRSEEEEREVFEL